MQCTLFYNILLFPYVTGLEPRAVPIALQVCHTPVLSNSQLPSKMSFKLYGQALSTHSILFLINIYLVSILSYDSEDNNLLKHIRNKYGTRKF